MRLGHTELFVRDPAVSRRFYEDVLGFDVSDVQRDGDVVWVALGDREILLRKGDPREPTPSYQSGEGAMVLFTDDVKQSVAELTRRGLEFRGDDGPGCPTFTDPDGHWFQLADPGHP